MESRSIDSIAIRRRRGVDDRRAADAQRAPGTTAAQGTAPDQSGGRNLDRQPL